jgi:hypothetical protein
VRRVLLGFVFLASGCVPWPHRETVVPEIGGVITLNGKPAAGVQVYLHNHLRLTDPKTPCSESENATITDSEGRFRFSEVDKLFMFLVVGDPIRSWGVCISHNGAAIIGWRRLVIGYGGPPVSLRCELTSSEAESVDGYGVCSSEGV